MTQDAGRSAAQEAAAAADLVRDLQSELRRAYARYGGFGVAAVSEPLTAAVLDPLASRGWRVLHDRRWPGSRRANVDHVVIGPPGVVLVDTKHWAGPVESRHSRLYAGDDDRTDSVGDLLRLTGSVEELLVDLGNGSRGQPVGLSAVHVVPVMALTSFDSGRHADTQVGRVRLMAARHLPALLTRLPAALSPDEVVVVADHLGQQMPAAADSEADSNRSRQRGSIIGVPARPEPIPARHEDPPEGLFELPDLAEQLLKAASAPVVEWMGFLHPAQTRLVRRSYAGPARVRGPAGTGKSVVMLHRAAWLAETRAGRVLVTTFVRTLPRHQHAVYERLSPGTADRVDFLGLHELAVRLLAEAGTRMNVNGRGADAAFQAAWSQQAAGGALAGIAESGYWREELDVVIKGRGLRRFVDYEALPRRGRSIPLNSTDRAEVWNLLVAYDQELERRGVHDFNDLLSAAVDLVTRGGARSWWASVVVDEVQDLPLVGVRLCALLGGTGADGLFLVGDGQQAIYPGGFTLSEAGVSVVGRATVLEVNYRNTRQILDFARVLVDGDTFSDLDGTDERGTRTVTTPREGPVPVTETAPTKRGLTLLLAQALHRGVRAGIPCGEMAVLVATRRDARYVRGQLAARDIPSVDLEDWNGYPDGNVKVGTVYRAKGLDFSAVYMPVFRAPDTSGSSLTETSGDSDVLRRRRQFVGQTRARDRLWVGRVDTRHPQRSGSLLEARKSPR